MTTTKKKEPLKCTIGGPWCSSLFDRMEAGNHGKGIRSLLIFNMKTGKERNLLSYKTSPKDRGLVMNFCPWCGEKLHKEV